jgi:hypothetical protein
MNNEQQLYLDIASALVASGVISSTDDIYYAPTAAEMVTAPDGDLPQVWICTEDGRDPVQNSAFSESLMRISIIKYSRYPDGTVFSSLAAQMIDSSTVYDLRQAVWYYQKGQETGIYSSDTWLDGEIEWRTDKSRLNSVITSSVSFNVKYEVNYE